MNQHKGTLGNIATRMVTSQNLAGYIAAAGVVLLLVSLFIAGCGQVQQTPGNILHITIDADSKQVVLQVPAGTTTQAVLQQAGITLSSLDRVDPPSYAVLSDNAVVHVTRVREVFQAKENIIPFESKRLNNESLPENTELLVQQGVNGREQVTNRLVYENDKEVSNTIFKTEILAEPQPEIKMIGVQ